MHCFFVFVFEKRLSCFVLTFMAFWFQITLNIFLFVSAFEIVKELKVCWCVEKNQDWRSLSISIWLIEWCVSISYNWTLFDMDPIIQYKYTNLYNYKCIVYNNWNIFNLIASFLSSSRQIITYILYQYPTRLCLKILLKK